MTIKIRYVWTEMYLQMVDYESELLDWGMDGGGDQYVAERKGPQRHSEIMVVNPRSDPLLLHNTKT